MRILAFLLACAFSAQASDWQFTALNGRPTWRNDNLLVIQYGDAFTLYRLTPGSLGNWGWYQTTWDKVADFDSLCKAENFN